MTIEDYPQWIKSRWSALRRALVEGYYQPQPAKRVAIPKPSGGERHLGIPRVHNRVIQQAISQVLTPILGPTFSNHSYGFRPGRRAHDAVSRIQHCIKRGLKVAVDIDLSKFFDRVNHDPLMTQLLRPTRNTRYRWLVRPYLTGTSTLQEASSLA
ncbi:reverse transcriptase domain-containing protein [uncultured Microbulbifer sp.]|uniref:reverse transcriptase domain-containing protein n=1 Tax=uncultured Microbulbifer sp. TaxID=348147 RepID=UPI00262D93EF|nr:reverse transcriptase domain-containing protein [uncultured Microbulbifer sp.]